MPPTDTDLTPNPSDGALCQHCGKPLERASETGECVTCYKRIRLGWNPPAPDDATQHGLPAIGGYVLCATCGEPTNAYLTQPTPEGDLYYCLTCVGTLTETKSRALGSHEQLPALTDWPDIRHMPHAALMASKRYALMHGDGWHMNETSDLLRMLGVRQEYEPYDSFGDFAAGGDTFTRSLALCDVLTRWRDILRARERGQRSNDQSAA